MKLDMIAAGSAPDPETTSTRRRLYRRVRSELHLPVSLLLAAVASLAALPSAGAADAPPPAASAASRELDARVHAFLERMRGQWHDWNVPPEDGQALYDLIVKKRFTHALEIGTSTGHSSIWMAWALSKTGGKLVTIEIDPARYHRAVENVEAAGLARYVDGAKSK
jgi:predicted O-methyltransferase YrrM